jgi:peptidoglycan/xylan/chitin deacetylase (PgdA/CDA1 family)
MASLAAVRRLTPPRKTLYLTFDDGPDGQTTAAVLDLLKRHQARTTFFVVAERAQKEKALVARLLREGHTLGNHSLDHTYRPFFQSQARLRAWIETSESILQNLSGQPSVGFRPPAGVQTPPLRRALAELGEPLILWNTRFFDALWPWREARARASLARAHSGDIVLLHDRQRPAHQARFLKTLDVYLTEATRAGFAFAALQRELMNSEISERPGEPFVGKEDPSSPVW